MYVLCGMVSSGKSTYCKNAADAGFLIVNDDAIVNLLHADKYTLYDKKLKVLYKSIENHIVSSSIGIGRSVIIDRGLNVSKNGRRRWCALADSFDVECEAIVFHNDGPEEHALRRFNSDPRGHDWAYWLDVARHHDKIWQYPGKEEGFTVVHEISYSDIKAGKVL